jgi:PAT family beta-lactamase induction signal transducer AmpG
MAFSSATHDIAADGFYMLGLEQHEQAAFAGVLATFYRLAMIAGEGALVVLAGTLEERFGSLHKAWEVTMLVVAGVMLVLSLYHLVMLPRPTEDARRPRSRQNLAGEFIRVFAEFFKKDRIAVTIAFLLLYRLAEAQLLKLVYPFLLDPRPEGGLGLDTTQVGYIKGTIGVAALLCGGLLGGLAVSKHGLRFWLWPMVLSMHLPDLAFVYLAYVKPESHAVVGVAIAAEQFGFGFGFTAYTMFMIMVSQGEHRTSHYAICTGFMALGMMLPGMFSGWIQDHVGYQNFFLWVIISTSPGFIVAALVRIPPDFGKKRGAATA